jgi:hypothetical protein
MSKTEQYIGYKKVFWRQFIKSEILLKARAILFSGEGGLKEKNGGGEFNYDIL